MAAATQWRFVVMGAGRGVGATVTAAALADALAERIPTALLSIAPPYSDVELDEGLTNVRLLDSGVPQVAFRLGQRPSKATVVRLTSETASMSTRPGFFSRFDVPSVKAWADAVADHQILVVDTSAWDVLDGMAGDDDPVAGWLSDRSGPRYPVVVCPASRPAVRGAAPLVDAVERIQVDQQDVTSPETRLAAPTLAVARTRSETRTAWQALVADMSPKTRFLVEHERRCAFVPESSPVLAGGVPATFERHLLAAGMQIAQAAGAVADRGTS